MSLEIRSYALGEEVPQGFTDLFSAGAYRQEDEALGAATAYLALQGSRVLARASGQKAVGLVGLGRAAGLIGHYEAAESEAGRALLDRVCHDLKTQGASIAIGPMNGSTWRRYRLALEPRNEAERGPAFLGEPENPPGYAADFEAAGFTLREEYESRRVPLGKDLPWDSYLPERVRARYSARIRPLDLADYEADLGRIYDESAESFDANTLFTPLSRAGFLEAFLPLKDFYDPEFVRLCCAQDGRVEGHVTAYPDGDQLILKTLSCRKHMRGLGLAHVLSYQVHELAFKRGFKGVVHALMHVENRSDRMSAELGRVIRRYGLFSRDL
jgi:hypothetical protein